MAKPFQPQTLFKYRSLGGERGRGTIENVLLHNRLWWQSPREFNDPFDASPIYRFEATAREKRNFLRDAAKRVMPENRHARRAKAADIAKRTQAENERLLQSTFEEFMASSAMSCFSTTGDQPLMWSHYADSHRGVCLEFIETAEPIFVGFPVIYSVDRPVINWVSERAQTDDMFKKAVLTKSADWSYEREVRMVDWRSPPGWRAFAPQALRSVTLGCRVCPDDEAFIRDLVSRRRYEPIRLSRARLHSRGYGLIFESA